MILPVKFSRNRGGEGEAGGGGGGGRDFCSKIKKVRSLFYTVPYSIYCKRVSGYPLYFSQQTVYDFTHQKSMNKFHFLRSLLQISCFEKFPNVQRKTPVHLCWSVFSIMLEAGRYFSVKFLKFLRMPLFSQNTSDGCFCNFQINDFTFSF